MSVRRRGDAGPTTSIMKHTKKSYLDWHIFVRFLDEKEVEKIDNISEAWGRDITAGMNLYFSNQRRDSPDQQSYGPLKKYNFAGVQADVVDLSMEVVQQDVVVITRVLFKDAVLNGELFTMTELVDLLFPGVANLQALFPDIM